MRGRLTIGGYHSNRLRCIVYFSTSTYICSCNLSIANSIIPDLLNLKVNIK